MIWYTKKKHKVYQRGNYGADTHESASLRKPNQTYFAVLNDI